MAKKPRTFTPELKAKAVLQILTGAKTTAQVCREHQLSETVVARWKQQLVAGASMVFAHGSPRAASDERTAELERLCGRLTLELEAAKKASQGLHQLASRNGG